MIKIIPYRSEWPQEFASLGTQIRQVLGDLAERIDHIGSTSVPGLAAKDIIDIQITVHDLDGSVQSAMERIGFSRLEGIWRDHVPPGAPETESQWTKWMFRPAAGQRLANLHVRIAGHLNQRYPLLFRDYLRSHPGVAEAYALVKQALATYHPDDAEAYYDVKDPVCDIIMGGAEEWAAVTNWAQSPSDC